MLEMNMLKIWSLALFTTFTIVSSKAAEADLSCSDKEYIHKGHCCRKCPAGFYVEADCTKNGSETKCRPCRNGTFANRMNDKKQCKPCRQCNAGMVPVKPCSTTTDNECRCRSTQYHDTNLDMCTACTHCPIGEYPMKLCSKNYDTQCQKCAQGHFSDMPKNFNSTCKKCTTCAKYKSHCNETHNAVCDKTNKSNKTTSTSSKPTSVLSTGTTTKEDNGDNAKKDTLDTAHIVLIVLLVVMFLIFGILLFLWRKKKTSSWRRRDQFPKLNESRYMPLPKVSQYNSGRLFREVPSKIFLGICERLNPPGLRNWKSVAAELGLTTNEIGNFECDPKTAAETMLCTWQTKDSATVGRLHECLLKIGREDVATYLAANLETNKRESIV